jgi:hypothetical protein
MPGVPATVKARKALRIARTHELLRKGWSLPQIAQDINVCVRQVKEYRNEAFKTISLYPSSYTADEVAQFRAEGAELVSEVESLAISTLEVVKGRVGTDEEKSLDATSVARLADSVARLSERKARLLGLDVPIKTVQEVFSLQVRKIDQRVTISWDQGLLAAPADPVPGLFIGGRTPAVALDNGSGSLNGHVMTADRGTNHVPDDSREVMA